LAQLNWTYYSLSGAPYLIEMYHGDDSQHLIIFVNGEIIQIAFNQAESKTYSFLIEQQLIELDIKAENGVYNYEVIPQKPKLPPGAEAEPLLSKQFWIPLIFLLVILNLAFYLYKSLNNLG